MRIRAAPATVAADARCSPKRIVAGSGCQRARTSLDVTEFPGPDPAMDRRAHFRLARLLTTARQGLGRPPCNRGRMDLSLQVHAHARLVGHMTPFKHPRVSSECGRNHVHFVGRSTMENHESVPASLRAGITMVLTDIDLHRHQQTAHQCQGFMCLEQLSRCLLAAPAVVHAHLQLPRVALIRFCEPWGKPTNERDVHQLRCQFLL